jgi:hypothetical protein
MCNCKPVVQLSEKGKSIVGYLKIMFFIYLAIIIVQIVLQNLSYGLFSIIALAILLTTFLTCHFLYAGICIFILMFLTTIGLFFLGLRIQNKIAGIPDQYSSSNAYYIIVIIFQCGLLTFYGFLIYYLFEAYKEFKALYFHRGYGKILK